MLGTVAAFNAQPALAVSCTWASVECSPDDGGFCILTRYDGSKEVWSLADVALVFPECLGLPDDGVLDTALDVTIPPVLSVPSDAQVDELVIMVTPILTAPTTPRLPDMSRLNGLVPTPTPPAAAPAVSDAVPGSY
jgi:hypothetical protein